MMTTYTAEKPPNLNTDNYNCHYNRLRYPTGVVNGEETWKFKSKFSRMVYTENNPNKCIVHYKIIQENSDGSSVIYDNWVIEDPKDEKHAFNSSQEALDAF